jgi:DNA-binding beta-propeller fold protein YncE
MERPRPRLRPTLLCALLALVLPPAQAGASPGALTQLPGTARCVSDTGTSGLCTDGAGLALAQAVTVSPDGRHAYAASAAAVTVFDRDPASGALTQKPGTAGCISDTGSAGACTDGEALQSPTDVVVSPDGEHVYATAYDSGSVAAFDRDPVSGLLTQVGCVQATPSGTCSNGAGLDGATALAVTPDGSSVYVASYAGALVVLDRTTPSGSLVRKPGTSGCVSDTGSGGACADGVALAALADVDVSPDGKNVYVAADNGFAVGIFDRGPGGAVAQKPGTAGCVSETGTGGACADGKALTFSRGVAVSPDGGTVYVASHVPGSIAVFDRDKTTGALLQRAGVEGCASSTGTQGQCSVVAGMGNAGAVAVSPDGASVYATGGAGGGSVVVLDRSATGVLTQKPGTAGCVNDSGQAPCADGVALGAVSAVALSPDSSSLYAVSGDDAAIAVFARERPGAPGPAPGGGTPGGGTPPPGAPAPPPPPPGSTPEDPRRIITVRTISNRDGSVSTVVSVSGPGIVSVTITGSSVAVRPARAATARRVVLARATRRVTRAGTVRLRLRPSAAARRALRRGRRITGQLRTVFRPVSGPAVASTKRVVLRVRR